MLARKMSSGIEQHGLLQSEYLEDLASQETGDQSQRVTRQTVRQENVVSVEHRVTNYHVQAADAVHQPALPGVSLSQHPAVIQELS